MSTTPSTDYETFKAMLTKGGTHFTEHRETGPTGDDSIDFEILAGGCGSKTTLATAFFDRKTGDFNGIHHCD